MSTQVILTLGFLALLGLVVMLASKSGSKAAKLENLKAELKRRSEEQVRAQKIISRVSNLPSDDVRKRLQDISGK